MPPSKPRRLPRLIVTVLIPLLLKFHKSRSKHHKNLTLIVPETQRPGRTGRPKGPQGPSVTRAALDVLEVATTQIPSEQLREVAPEI